MRTVRIFLSSPSGLESERADLAALVRDINDTIQFLAPEQGVRLELVHYETHSFPDVGSPQEVIDRQIPIDFDIYFGMMWKRCGTPTHDAPSGTVHEFNLALAHRAKHGWPVIMFFFSEQEIGMPDPDELRQLEQVLEFRQRLADIGYTVSYPNHDGFREAARGRLLRAIADVIRRGDRPAADDSSGVVASDVERRLRALTTNYDMIRTTMDSGAERTREMTRVFQEMVAMAATTRALLGTLKTSDSAGERLAAISILNAFPSEPELDWLASRLANPNVEKPFVGYQAAMALVQAVRSLPTESGSVLRRAIEQALALARTLPQDSDRIRVLESATRELDARVAPWERLSSG